MNRNDYDWMAEEAEWVRVPVEKLRRQRKAEFEELYIGKFVPLLLLVVLVAIAWVSWRVR